MTNIEKNLVKEEKIFLGKKIKFEKLLKMQFKLGSKIISEKGQPYFIAEIGVNYENNLKRAKKIIKLAKDGGADAVKFQSYKAEKIACKESPYYWDLKEVPVKSQYELFKKFDKFGFTEFKF